MILTFIASFIRLVYPILLVTTIMQTISFSGFSNDFALKKGGEVSEKGRFEIQNFSLNSKRQKVVLQSLNETEQLLNDYSKANYFVDANILDKISITFLSDRQMKGAMGAFSAEGTSQKPTIYLNTDWLNTGISSFDVTKVLLEEYGHYLDSKYSSSDRVGDEGELFANIVLGSKISTSDLMRIMTENDHNTIDDNGKIVAVEQATVYFNQIYKASTLPRDGTYDIQDSPILGIQLVSGSAYRFVSSNPADASYIGTTIGANGNNVAGNLVYIDINNVQQTIAGFISRQDKNGGPDPLGFYFVPANYPTADAYLFVVPGFEAFYSSIAASSSPDVRTSSDFTPADLNSVLSSQASLPILSVSSPTASENAGYMTFTISLSVINSAVTTFTPSLIAGTATAGSDYTSSMEYFNGSSWTAITSTLSIPAGTTSIQLRVPITNDATTESAETFTLKTGAISGGTILNSSGTFGTGTITDAVPTITSTGTLSSF